MQHTQFERRHRHRDRLRLYRGPLLAALGLSLFAAATANAAGADGDRVGTYPANISAVIAAVAFVVTVTIFVLERRDRVREQANAVYAWQQIRGDAVDVDVVNRSDHPVWDVQVTPRKPDETIHAAPDAEGSLQIEPEQRANWSWTLSREVIEHLGQPELRFTDAAGRKWLKTGSHLKKD